MLINIAKRNYDKFLVPTSLVSADKMNRYFTSEQKADLDIKTSVNKIGEIINFSQILNSIFWDNIAHGQTFEKNQELYADIAQLDVMSNLEIDKAKKIFEVDNAIELKRLKKKYDLKDDKGLEVRPNFFEHISRKKGYYIAGKKNYKVHKTSMDYLQKVLVNIQTRTRKSSTLGMNPISSVLNGDHFNTSEVNYKQVENVIDVITSYRQNSKQIWAKNKWELSTNEKIVLVDRLTYNMIFELSRLKFNYSTAYYLMRRIDTNSDSKEIRNLAFYTLLSLPITEFYSVFDKSQSDIVHILRDAYAPDCNYFGVGYRHLLWTGDNTYEDLPEKRFGVSCDMDTIFTKFDEKAV